MEEVSIWERAEKGKGTKEQGKLVAYLDVEGGRRDRERDIRDRPWDGHWFVDSGMASVSKMINGMKGL